MNWKFIVHKHLTTIMYLSINVFMNCLPHEMLLFGYSVYVFGVKCKKN